MNDHVLQGEFAKDDNISALSKEAIADLTAILSQMDTDSIEDLHVMLGQELWDRQNAKDLAQFELEMPF